MGSAAREESAKAHELVVLRGATREQLRLLAEDLSRAQAGEYANSEFGEIRSGSGSLCLAIVASSRTDLAGKLTRAASMLADSRKTRIRDRSGIYFESHPLHGEGAIAILFPGEGSQYPGCMENLRAEFPDLKRFFGAFGDTARPDDEMARAVGEVIHADLMIWYLLRSIGVPVHKVLGHSTGEIVALAASGMIDVATREKFEKFAADLRSGRTSTDNMPRVTLLAAGTDPDTVRALSMDVADAVHIGMENCAHQTVIVAEGASGGLMTGRMREKGILFETMDFDRPYHTEMFRPFAERIAQVYEKWISAPPIFPTYTSCTASLFPDSLADTRVIATEQWVKKVRFRDTIEAMYADGARIFVESGMRGNLTAFVDDILRGRPHAAIAADLANRGSREQLLHLSAQLAVHGVPLTVEKLSRPAAVGPEPSIDAIKPLPASEAASATTKIRSTRPSEARNAVIAAHLEYMSQFFATQEAVMTSYISARSSTPGAVNAGKAIPVHERIFPVLGTIVSHIRGDELVAVRDSTLDEDRYLRDHTFGREVSEEDPNLFGLPIVPLTMSIEIMAEAAAALFPDSRVVAIQDVRARRWVTQETDQVTLRVEAKAGKANNTCAVKLYKTESPAESAPWARSPVAEATVILADSFPEQPLPVLYCDRPLPVSIGREAVYEDIMFHGPAFQAISRVDCLSESAAAADVEILPRDSLFRSNADPQFIIDPVLLDQVGQLLGVWCAIASDTLPNAFPSGIDRIELFAPQPPAGDLVRCVTAHCVFSSDELYGDAEVVDSSGRVAIRVSGWHDRRFDLPTAFVGAWSAASGRTLSKKLNATSSLFDNIQDIEASSLSLESFPEDFFAKHRGVWMTTLAAITLSRSERADWKRVTHTAVRRLEWLLGRVAAKDAVRRLLLREHNVMVRPADIEIAGNAGQGPTICLPRRLNAEPPVISISHSSGHVVAVAGLKRSYAGIGIDIEHRSRMTEEVMLAGLVSEELDLIAGISAVGRIEAALRLWCAKEAVLKAADRGPDTKLMDYVALSADYSASEFEIAEKAAHAGIDSRFSLRARTVMLGDLCLAVAAIGAITSTSVEQGAGIS